MALPAHRDATDAWRVLRAELRRRIGGSTFDIWLGRLHVADWDGTVMVLAGPRETELWVAGRYGRQIAQAAEDVLGPGTRLRFAGAENAAGSAVGPAVDGAAAADLQTAFNPRYRFEQFVIGETNRVAHAAALAVAENPGQTFNPLFLYAPPGLGKTHLLHAIGNYTLAFGGGATVRYVTAESFTNHFLTALTSRSLDGFKRTYRDTDILLVDDVQFLADKARTEEEFFHTFNALYESGRQLVLTCDRLPRALTSIEQRLRERFEAGLVADIKAPDHATRVAILRKRVALDDIVLCDPAVLDLIADRVPQNIRLLEGALIRVVAYHSLTGRPIDIPLTTEVLDVTDPATRAPGRAAGPSIADIQSVVARRFDVGVEQLTSSSRAATVNWPRQLAISLARDLTGQSLPAIGAAFGGRNHTTVMHACKRVSERCKTDQDAVQTLAQLRRDLGNR